MPADDGEAQARSILGRRQASRAHASTGHVSVRQPFAGYREYYLEEALAEPAHPHWSGAGLIGPAGDLIGIGLLWMEQQSGGETTHSTCSCPPSCCHPILNGPMSGKPARPPHRSASVVLSAGGPVPRGDLRRLANGVARRSRAELTPRRHRPPPRRPQSRSDTRHLLPAKRWALGRRQVIAPLTIQRGTGRLRGGNPHGGQAVRLQRRRRAEPRGRPDPSPPGAVPATHLARCTLAAPERRHASPWQRLSRNWPCSGMSSQASSSMGRRTDGRR